MANHLKWRSTNEMAFWGRAVCRYLGYNRSTLRYRPKPVPEKKHLLEMEIVSMSKKYPTLGYKKVTKLLRDDGWRVNKKQVQRIRREEGRVAGLVS